MSVTEDQKIVVLVYKEDHPRAYPPEISKATGIDYSDVVYILREHAASQQRFKIEVKNEFEDEEVTRMLAANLEHFCLDKVNFEVVDVTPCASRINHGPGHQSTTYCEVTGPHTTHGAEIMGMWEEWEDEDSNDG